MANGETMITVNPKMCREWWYAMRGKKAPPMKGGEMPEESTNERVAVSCGFTLKPNDKRFCIEYMPGGVHLVFAPDTDPAAAKKAAEVWAKKWSKCIQIEIQPCPDGLEDEDGFKWLWACRISDPLEYAHSDWEVSVYDEDFCTAICNAILAAEEGRNDSE